DAVTRNRLAVLLPSANPVQRLGSGYVQDVVSAQSPTVHYLILKSDRAAIAYILTGDLLTAYLAAGGPTGSLGYPASDANPGGTQRFENGAALAGSPVFVVAGPVLTKWAALGYETGPAGPPTGNTTLFSSVSGYSGVAQPFAKGVIFAITSGNRAGQAYLVGGPILVRYGAIGGPNGSFGVPTSDEFSISGMRRQNFEDGYIDYTPGDAAAVEHAAERLPAVSANPGAVAPGTRIRLSVTGFSNGSTLRVSVTGQPDFLVLTPSGSYDWEVYVPAAARSGVVQVHAADVNSAAVANGSYIIKSLAELRPQLVKMQGDGQSGPPGATLVQPLRVALRDSAGNSIAGVPVSFQASGGGLITPVSSVTDANGQAAATYRLPLSAGISAATASAGGQIATFDFRSSTTTLANFPQFTSAIDSPLGAGPATIAQKGGLLTAVAAMVRFYQNRGELAAVHGLADPASLNQFLQTLPDGFVSNPMLNQGPGEQVVNLWRVTDFVGGGLDVSVEDPDPAHVRDLVAAGSPVLLSLSLTVDGRPAGGSAVVATGIGDDGRILIQDPNPAFARTSLSDYLAGFPVSLAGGTHAWKGTLVSAVRLIARAPSGAGFLLTAVSQSADAIKALDISSVMGHCGVPLDLPDAAVSGFEPPASVAVSRFIYCDGAQPMYQVNAASVPASLTALGAGGSTQTLAGSAAGVYKVSRTGAGIAIGPQDVSFSSTSVVNAATFANGLAPGGLFSIFGTGLAPAGADPFVKIGASTAPLVVASPFQINAQVPPDLAPGIYTLQVESALGVSGQPVEVLPAAPGIFVLGTSSDGQPLGAVVNQDGKVNRPATPALRGEVITIYCTGLGAVTRQGNLSVTSARVSAVLSGSELRSSFSGLTPGFIGLYQVNVPIPLTTPPGLGLPLSLRVALRDGNVDSNTVFAAVQ
ncbi:MAG: Ig-like domain-containing protein, partial [Acidobacteriota bacterium]|nr:Ig-like domain-containing protein [Acidobacteriota bacterium]